MALAEVEPSHVEKWLGKLASAAEIAPRTQRHVFNDVRLALASAVKAGTIGRNPTDGVEPPKKRDADPEWRSQAVYERREIEALIHDDRIAFVRRVYYALCALAGLRTGEVAALTLSCIEAREPLNCLWLRSSFNTKRRQVGALKARREEEAKPRQVPIHPVLRALLTEWTETGWEATFGRAPTPEDILVSKPFE